MKLREIPPVSVTIKFALLVAFISMAATLCSSQQPAAGARGGGRGGGLPGATPEQTQAVADMNATLAPLTVGASAARSELATATFAGTRNDPAIKAAIEKLQSAELALAMKRAEEFAKLQAGPNKLNADQVNALISSASQQGGRGGFPGGGAAPGQAAPAGRANQ
jgi:hypothetical protein